MTKCFSFFRRRTGGGSSKGRHVEDNLSSKSSVNREYLSAFRTKSYVEICNKAQECEIESTSTSTSMSSSTRSPLSTSCSTSSSLLEPRQEIVRNVIKCFKVHHLLVDYFEASLEAYLCCDKILQGIRQTRFAYGMCAGAIVKKGNDENVIYKELVSFVINNSLFMSNNVITFRDNHEKQVLLLDRLNMKKLKLRRRITIKRLCKKVGGISFVVSLTALLLALLLFAFNSIIGLAAAPFVMGGFFGLMKKKRFKGVHGKYGSTEKLYEQIDVAAKGVYIMINDLDTMSRMVKRLEAELEHWREVADICVKSYSNGNGRYEMLKMIVREFHDCQTNFMDQLEELEEHIYLCFLTINRSRRLIMQKITEK